jgi:menaquinone-dependent protoporphyrinogen oxidase
MRHAKLGMVDSVVLKIPAVRDVTPEGDFRDWAEIEAWARVIATDLTPALAPA